MRRDGAGRPGWRFRLGRAATWIALLALLGLSPLGLSGCSGAGGFLNFDFDRTFGRVDLAGSGWHLWLDRDADWEHDDVLAPPVDVARLVVRPPSAGWSAMAEASMDVAVPGTVEEHLWERLGGDGIGPHSDVVAPDSPPGDYRGVSWWWRDVPIESRDLLAGEDGVPRRVLVHFEAVRLRAEVFVNDRLVGYDAVGNTPFDVDVTDAVHAGSNLLAVRVTDPCGNFDWTDADAQRWGEHTVPASHGFGGITGPVWLRLVPAVWVDDVFVENTPAVTDVVAHVTVRNVMTQAVYRDVVVEVEGKRVAGHDPLGRRKVTLPHRFLAPGDTMLSCAISVPEAEAWSPEQPSLYTCSAVLSEGGGERPKIAPGAFGVARFGFRWFEPDVSDTSAPDGAPPAAVFRLNGHRIVLRSAISWGLWPISGSVPTPELARRQVETARALGLNMLNHHRTIAAPGLLDVQDEMGLLAYEEPGGYACHGGDALCEALAREKLLRMVRRDRNHPSLVIVNMINEELAAPAERARRDMADAHALDPTRTITYTSGWAGAGPDPIKLHMRPGDTAPNSTTPHEEGWSDYHHAAGPGVWRDEFWNGPDDHVLATDDRGEIVFWGEEGAIAAPPRLQLIDAELQPMVARGASLGWDGAAYLQRFGALSAWLKDKGFARAFPDVDSLTVGLGNVAFDYQRRAIETVRLADTTDGYVINGWEDSKLENHSGIVDCWRHPKGDPALLASANAPLALAVKLRSSVAALGAPAESGGAVPPIRLIADIGLINEAGLQGSHRLVATLADETGRALWSRSFDVDVAGGETFGQVLARDVAIEAAAAPGRLVLSAELAPATPAEQSLRGEDELLVVDWRSGALPAGGAMLESRHALRNVIRDRGGEPLPSFFEGLPRLAYVLVGDYDPAPQELVPDSALLGPSGGDRPGLDAEFFDDEALQKFAAKAVLTTVDCEWSREDPVPGIGRTHFSVRVTGRVRAAEAGDYVLHAQSDDGVRLWVDGALAIDHWDDHARTTDHSPPLTWAAGSTHEVRLEYRQGEGDAVLRLLWTTPARAARVSRTFDELLRRAREDGTTVCFLDHADLWAGRLAEAGALQCDGVLEHGNYWLGGGFFARSHPLLDGLPADCALGRPYQELVNYRVRRYGLLLHGEEAVIGCLTGHDPRVATALGIVPCGKGRLLLSTLDIVHTINGPPGPADVVRRLAVNIARWAGSTPR